MFGAISEPFNFGQEIYETYFHSINGSKIYSSKLSYMYDFGNFERDWMTPKKSYKGDFETNKNLFHRVSYFMDPHRFFSGMWIIFATAFWVISENPLFYKDEFWFFVLFKIIFRVNEKCKSDNFHRYKNFEEFFRMKIRVFLVVKIFESLHSIVWRLLCSLGALGIWVKSIFQCSKKFCIFNSLLECCTICNCQFSSKNVSEIVRPGQHQVGFSCSWTRSSCLNACNQHCWCDDNFQEFHFWIFEIFLIVEFLFKIFDSGSSIFYYFLILKYTCCWYFYQARL